MPEVNNIPSSLSYRPADPAEPVLDISIGDALRAATSTWRTRSALIDGTSEKQTRRRWTFEELLAESEKVARALLRFVSGEHVAIWAANGPQPVFSTSMARWSRAARSASYGSTAPTSLSAIGDLMRQGEGDDLWFVSRKKDLIIRGGSNISPAEVERVLKTTSGRCVSRSFDEHF